MKPPRLQIALEVITSLAQEFATERLTSLPGGQVWFKAFKHRGEIIWILTTIALIILLARSGREVR